MAKPAHWSDMETTRLKALWWGGKTVRQCADALGRTNLEMVREKIDREGFVRNPELYGNDAPILPLPRADGSLVTIRDVKERECRWISGDASANAVMCGRPIYRGMICESHWIRGHQRGPLARL